MKRLLKGTFVIACLLTCMGAQASTGNEITPEETAEIRYFLSLSPEQRLLEINAGTAALAKEVTKEMLKEGAREAVKEVVKEVAERVKEYFKGSKNAEAAMAEINAFSFDTLPAPTQN